MIQTVPNQNLSVLWSQIAGKYKRIPYKHFLPQTENALWLLLFLRHHQTVIRCLNLCFCYVPTKQKSLFYQIITNCLSFQTLLPTQYCLITTFAMKLFSVISHSYSYEKKFVHVFEHFPINQVFVIGCKYSSCIKLTKTIDTHFLDFVHQFSTAVVPNYGQIPQSYKSLLSLIFIV